MKLTIYMHFMNARVCVYTRARVFPRSRNTIKFQLNLPSQTGITYQHYVVYYISIIFSIENSARITHVLCRVKIQKYYTTDWIQWDSNIYDRHTHVVIVLPSLSCHFLMAESRDLCHGFQRVRSSVLLTAVTRVGIGCLSTNNHKWIMRVALDEWQYGVREISNLCFADDTTPIDANKEERLKLKAWAGN